MLISQPERLKHVNVEELIELRGDTVKIYGRTESGADEYGRPIYQWSLKAEEKALIQHVRRYAAVGEIILPAGELQKDDRVGYFKADSVIDEDDQVEWMGHRYEVAALQPRTLGDRVLFKVAYLRRLIE